MSKSKLENKLLAVVRIRGRTNIRDSIEETLQRMNLKRVNNLSLIYGTKSNLGMLYKCKDYVTFGEVDSGVLKALLEKKCKNAEEAAAIMSGTKKPKDAGIKLPIRMTPPKHGYKAIKLPFANKGDLGYRGEKINDLIKRMM
jgi:large subunit ribosomal protein L30